MINEFNVAVGLSIVKLSDPVKPDEIDCSATTLSSSVANCLGPVPVKRDVRSFIESSLLCAAPVDVIVSTVCPLETPVKEVAVTPV